MKTELQAKFLQHLAQKKQKQEEGFTLIELLVVIIIIGILSAIALPSFLNQANKARESEARQYAGSMNRAQQAYYLEKTEFATEISTLGLGLRTQTDNFTYTIDRIFAGGTGVANLANPTKGVSAPLRSFAGGAKVGIVLATSEATTLAVLCQTTKPRVVGGANGTNAGVSITTAATVEPACAATGWESVK